MDLTAFGHVKDHQEGHDDLFFAGLLLQKGPEAEIVRFRDPLTDIAFTADDIIFFPFDLAKSAADGIHAVPLPAQDLLEGLFQAFNGRFSDQLLIIDGRLIGLDFFRQLLLTVEIAGSFHAPVTEFIRLVADHFIFQQAFDQFLAGICLFLFLVRFFFFGKQHPALQLQKGRCHDQELTGNLHLLFPHLLDIFQVLVCDQGNRDVIYINFMFIDQV